MKKLMMAVAIMLTAISMNAKTLVVYYSYTNNVNSVVTELTKQIEADVVRIEPAEKGLDYAANNYEIGSAQIAAIRNNPNDASSYPAIDPVDVNLADYDSIIIGAPLWWSQMAAPLQTFLFNNGSAMAGKKIGLIVSSASSGISGVESDAKRLIPGGDFLSPSLWIRSSQTSNSATLIQQWLKDINYDAVSGVEDIRLENGRQQYTVYTISGSLIGKDLESIDGLDKGLYIINGKKTCK
ncbi:MAG: flavodoxin [Muribaculaceae bacterium]|nr:flavodoxin [Muribaculaceae bacterium]